MLQLEKLSKSYNRQQVLKEVTLEVKSGCITAIVGPNGAGKSTIIKCILGLVKPDHGLVSVENKLVNGNCDYREDIGYMPQTAKFPENLTVRNIFNLVSDIRQKTLDNLDWELIKEFKLEGEYNKKLKNLSGGTRQKVNASLAFLFDPKILILDEPTASLDPIASGALKRKIKTESKNGKTILLSSHIMSEVEELSDNIIFLLEGEIVYQGGTKELLNKSNNQGLEQVIAQMMERG